MGNVTLSIRVEDLLLDSYQLGKMFHCSDQIIEQMSRNGEFPKPFRLKDSAKQCYLWRIEDVKSFIDRQVKPAAD